MTTYTVLLTTQTTGTVTAEHIEVGQIVTVDLRDENGMPIKATGEVQEILVEA